MLKNLIHQRLETALKNAAADLNDLSVDENLLEAISDFGASDVDCLFVVDRQAKRPLLLGALFRGDVMRRYREELLYEER